jgi:hypothetical protein
MAKRNRLNLQIPPTANSIVLTIEVPTGIYKNVGQGASIQVGGGSTQHQALHLGSQDVIVPLPVAVRGTKVQIAITLDESFVPAKLGMNNDTTEYSAFLRSVAFS